MHPIAFKLGPLSIHWYGILVAIGFLAGLWTAAKRGLKDGIPSDRIHDLGIWLIIGAASGARILYVITFWKEQFAGKPISEIFMIQRGGLVFYGGFIGATLAGVIYARLKNIKFWKVGDVLAPSLALGYAFGRIGCLFTGCCYGSECHLPWAIRFPPGHETHPVGEAAIPVHPTQIYESLLSFALYGGLAWLYRRKKFDGQIFAAYLVVYALLRSFLELFRGDYPTYQRLGGLLTPGQQVSVIMLMLGIGLLFFLSRTKPAQQS